MLGGEGKVGLYRQIGIDQIGLAVEQDFLWRLVDLGDRAEQRQAKLALGFCRVGDTFVNLLETKGQRRADAEARDRKSVVKGRSVSGRVELGGGRIIKKKKAK